MATASAFMRFASLPPKIGWRKCIRRKKGRWPIEQPEFKLGDSVIVNGRYSAFRGRTGTVRYAAEGHYWLEFSDSERVNSGFHTWCLESFLDCAYKDEQAA